MIDAGAVGYLIKAADLDEIAVAIRSIAAGRIFICHSQHTLATPPSNASDYRPDDGTEDHQLSRREREVISLLADGMTNKQVAERLFLSVKTVETYRSRVMRKCGFADRTELVQFARQHLVSVA